jgi:hypothetical protein
LLPIGFASVFRRDLSCTELIGALATRGSPFSPQRERGQRETSRRESVRGRKSNFEKTVMARVTSHWRPTTHPHVARLRIVRAHLREVIPAMKVGDVAKARKSFEAFDSSWDSIEDLIKARSGDNYVAVEKGMIEIEQALMSEKPDPAKVTALVTDVLAKYNASLAEVVKEARSRP